VISEYKIKSAMS